MWYKSALSPLASCSHRKGEMGEQLDMIEFAMFNRGQTSDVLIWVPEGKIFIL